MDTPVQDIIVGNIPGARGPDTDTKPRKVKYTSQCITDTLLSIDKQARPSLKLIKLQGTKRTN